ncbi:GNAT family N-acetyltransferase [Dyella humi]|uniref:GNAT family N-acetyltransferase n=1 Tax=Dyella humi TaxID=1770547 RepID=A0ABW8IJK4_9GAMM
MAKTRFPDLIAIEYDHELVGVLSLDIDNELAVHVLSPFQGRGIAKEACRQFFEICVDRGIRQLTAKAIQGNAGQSLLKSLGAEPISQRTNGADKTEETYFIHLDAPKTSALTDPA